jgi:hypothetical protein
MSSIPPLEVCQQVHQSPVRLTRWLGAPASSLTRCQALSDGHGDREDRLLLAGLIAPDLASIDAGRLGEIGLRQPQLCAAAAADDLGHVHGTLAALKSPGPAGG